METSKSGSHDHISIDWNNYVTESVINVWCNHSVCYVSVFIVNSLKLQDECAVTAVTL